MNHESIPWINGGDWLEQRKRQRRMVIIACSLIGLSLHENDER